MSETVFVGNLSFQTNESELATHFGEAGTVRSVRIPLDRDTGRSRGFGFVEFESAEQAQKAVETLNEQELGGRPLRVREAESRPPRGAGSADSRPGRGPGRSHGRSAAPAFEPPELDRFDGSRPGKGRKGGWRNLRGTKRTL